MGVRPLIESEEAEQRDVTAACPLLDAPSHPLRPALRRLDRAWVLAPACASAPVVASHGLDRAGFEQIRKLAEVEDAAAHVEGERSANDRDCSSRKSRARTMTPTVAASMNWTPLRSITRSPSSSAIARAMVSRQGGHRGDVVLAAEPDNGAIGVGEPGTPPDLDWRSRTKTRQEPLHPPGISRCESTRYQGPEHRSQSRPTAGPTRQGSCRVAGSVYLSSAGVQ